MAKRITKDPAATAPARRPSALIDTRVVYCGDCLDQLHKLPDACIDLIYIDPPFNSNRNYEVFWGDMTEPRPSGSGTRACFDDRQASTAAYIDYMRPRCVELARVLKKTGSFYYHCDWHACRRGVLVPPLVTEYHAITIPSWPTGVRDSAGTTRRRVRFARSEVSRAS